MTRHHDRDQVIGQALGVALKQGTGAPAGDCPDPEVLAAYCDRSLDARERRRWDAHFASCARCQHQLALIVTSGPAGPPEPAAPRWSAWKWLVPAAAAGTAFAAWLTVGPVERPAGVTTPPPAESVATKTAAPDLGADRSSEAARPAPAPAVPPVAAARPAPGTRADAAMRGQVVAVEPAPAPAPEADRKVADAAAPLLADEKRAQLAAAEQAEPPAPAQGATPPPATASGLGGSAPGRQPAKAAAPVALLEATQPAAAEREARGRLAAVRLEVRSPDPTIVWRVTTRGEIERSRDGGQTWERQAGPVGVELTAGAAPSPTACWLVGARGVVWRTADGERWERLASPADAPLVRVEARDALQATIVTRDGRRFSTTDGGRTWK